jgi:hypothetical protein
MGTYCPQTNVNNTNWMPWRRGIVSACHRGDCSYWSWDRIPPGYRVVAFYRKKARAMLTYISTAMDYFWNPKPWQDIIHGLTVPSTGIAPIGLDKHEPMPCAPRAPKKKQKGYLHELWNPYRAMSRDNNRIVSNCVSRDVARHKICVS